MGNLITTPRQNRFLNQNPYLRQNHFRRQLHCLNLARTFFQRVGIAAKGCVALRFAPAPLLGCREGHRVPVSQLGQPIHVDVLGAGRCARSRSRNVEPPDASPTGLVSSSRSRLRTHLDVAQRSNCPSKIKNQFGYHAQDRRARREGRRRNEVPIDSGAPPSALQPATTRRSNSVGRWPRSGAGAEAENTRSCQGAGRFWNEDRLPPAEPGR